MIYLHETIKIRGAHRFEYMEHMASFGPIARVERKLLNVGIWGTINSTEHEHLWPQVVNLWAFTEGWTGVAANFRHEYSHESLQDDSLRPWWRQATEFRLGGVSRLMVPADYSPHLDALLADHVHGPVYFHQTMRTRPRGAVHLLEVISQTWPPIADRFGMRLVGAFRTAMGRQDEVIVIWACNDWDGWAEYESVVDTDPLVLEWERMSAPLLLDYSSKLMVASHQCALAVGEVI